MNNKIVFYEPFTLTPGSFDRYSNITPYAIFDIFQEIAARHAESLNATLNKLTSPIIWLLLRNKYEIVTQIKSPIQIKVKTWPLKQTRVNYDREYQIFDLNNNLLVKGTSKWCVYDLETRQISRDKIDFNGVYLTEQNFKEPLKKIRVLPLNGNDLALEFKVLPSHLDINDHMNNAKYSFCLLDALNLKSSEVIKGVEFNYLKELNLNDIVQIYKRKIDNIYYCYGFIQETIYFSAKVTLEKSN